MQFKDIIGQPEVKQNLTELVQHNRLSHALLFLGKEGSGVLPLALAFAQYVVCEKVSGKWAAANQPGPSLFGDQPDSPLITHNSPVDSCGICPACIKAQQFIHPDIHFSYPVVTKNQEHHRSARIIFQNGESLSKVICMGMCMTGCSLLAQKTNKEI